MPGVGLQSLQADEEGDGQVSVSAAVLQDDTNAINLFRRAMATVRERKRLGKVIL